MSILLFMITFSSLSSGQTLGCQRITIDDLGNTTAPSQQGNIKYHAARTSCTKLIIYFLTGLISGAISSGDGALANVQVFAMNIVCEVVASQRGYFSVVSVVANYTIDTAPDNVLVGQFEFMCSSAVWSGNVLTTQSASTPGDATFNTPLRRDCSLCIEPTSLLLSSTGGTYDNITHCVCKYTV